MRAAEVSRPYLTQKMVQEVAGGENERVAVDSDPYGIERGASDMEDRSG